MATTPERHLALIICPARWAANFAVEDWRHLTQRLKLDLLGAGSVCGAYWLMSVPTGRAALNDERARLTRGSPSVA